MSPTELNLCMHFHFSTSPHCVPLTPCTLTKNITIYVTPDELVQYWPDKIQRELVHLQTHKLVRFNQQNLTAKKKMQVYLNQTCRLHLRFALPLACFFASEENVVPGCHFSKAACVACFEARPGRCRKYLSCLETCCLAMDVAT